MHTELLFRDDAYLRMCEARVLSATEQGIVLDRTVFYPMGGGQPGDTGVLRWTGGQVRIIDTRKGDAPDTVKHLPEPGSVLPKPGDGVSAEIDWDRRYAHMRIHTCLHVLSCVVVAPVTGGNIAADKGRLDFDIDMSQLDAERIEAGVNELSARAIPTETVWITDAELDSRPDLVKTMSVQPPRGAGQVRLLRIEGIDLQPCGGTHVRNIGEIGRVRVLRIRSEGKRNKRVEIGFG
jgi:misacylated tRNA(Ala) deacylase